MKEKLEKWDRWLETIYEDMCRQAESRMMYQEVAAIITGNPEIPKNSGFLDLMEQWYVDSSVMGLRRQLKTGDDSLSLAGLLEDIAPNSSLLSRERFVSLYPGYARSIADRAFDKHAGVGAAYVDGSAVRADLERLKDLAACCEEYADRFVAHRDKRGLSTVPTYGEFNQAIAFAQELLQKYFLFLRGGCLKDVTPKIPCNWKRIFEIPWIRPGQPG